jgi:hypothetical protein
MHSPIFKTHRWDNRNPCFNFHPMHSVFSLLATLTLLGLVAWFVMWMPR